MTLQSKDVSTLFAAQRICPGGGCSCQNDEDDEEEENWDTPLNLTGTTRQIDSEVLHQHHL